jgi:hypothetical protein
VQAVAGVRFGSAADIPGTCQEVAKFALRASRILGSTVVWRISVDRARRLSQLVAVMAPANADRTIREAFASFTRIERRFNAAVQLSPTRRDHDSALHDLPRVRFTTSAEAFSVAGVRLACDYRVAPSVDELLLTAASAEQALSYQVHIRSFAASAEAARAARKNVLALASLPGASERLLARQEHLARGLLESAAICEEYVAVDVEAAAGRAAGVLRESLRARFAALGYPPPALRFEVDAHQEAITLGVHSHDLNPFGPVDLCGSCLSIEERDRLLGWQPSAALLESVAADHVADATAGHESPAAAPGSLALPAPYGGQGAFAFISYKRQDLPAIAPILHRVVEHGLPVWFDRGIPGGKEWDEVIEERLCRCKVVLLFASRAAIESKYVRREVKFADALDTPIVTVLLEEASLSYGLRMLLTQYQMIDARATDFPTQLARALSALM